MKSVAKTLGLLALAATLLPPVLVLAGVMAEGPMKLVLLLATILWFATAPFWLKGGE